MEQFLNQDQIGITVDTNSVIDEITVDPRVRGQQEAWRIAWIKGLGFSNEINRSLLYQNTLMVVPLFSQEELAKIYGGFEKASLPRWSNGRAVSKHGDEAILLCLPTRWSVHRDCGQRHIGVTTRERNLTR